MIHSYPKVYNLGHMAIEDLLCGEVVVQEKIDGSQFSFMRTEDGLDLARSHHKPIDPHANEEKMFQHACETVRQKAGVLRPGWVYRAEYLQKPKHNTLAYDRTPKDYVILFDVDTGGERYLTQDELRTEAARIGLEVVPCLFDGHGRELTMTHLDAALSTISILGGQTIEGVAIKAYGRFGKDAKTLMGKHVSERFKEMNKTNWKAENPTQADVITTIGQSLRTEARWDKAVQHLRERGELLNDPKDIGPLLKEVEQDTLEECGPEIQSRLIKWAMPQIVRQVRAGLPEWYKRKLAAQQFEPRTEETTR